MTVTTGLLGQNQSLKSQLETALSKHESATNFEQELAAAENFKSISNKNPSEWLPAYWAAFTYSQAGRISKDKIKYYEIAFDYFSKAEKNLTNPTSDEKVYLMSLKALLCSLSQGPNFASGNGEKGIQYATQENEAINEGLKINSNNPLILVMLGTKIISEGLRAKPSVDISKLVIGKMLLKQAKALYKKVPNQNNLTPNRWNEPWINVWLQRLKRPS